MANWLELNSIYFSYDNKPILVNCRIILEKPGLYICTGASGVGKTTLALLLSGHLIPSKGQIFLDGSQIKGPSRSSILVTQEDDLFPWLKVRDQIIFFTKFEGAIKEIDPLIDRLHLRDAVNMYPHQLSGGMKKRLALLRAVVLKPRLLILDETFSSIDIELREKILEDFALLWKNLNIGTILITHDLITGMKKHASHQIIFDSKGIRKVDFLK